MATVYAGVDVGKEFLDLALDKYLGRWPNTAAGRRRLLEKIARIEGVQVVCESTGGYEAPLIALCHERQIPACAVPPGRVRQFADSCGLFAKTDPIDATTIPRWAAVAKPLPTLPPTPEQRELTELISRRQQVMDQINRQEQQVAGLTLPAVRKLAAQTAKRLQRELAAIEALIEAVATGKAFKAKVEILVQIPGVGYITALTVLAYAPELGLINRARIAALAGLAPYNHDSGLLKGKRSISGGRQHLRNCLFLPAMTACVHHPKLKAQYEKMVTAGKPKRVAQTAIMRKLLTIMNAVLREYYETPKIA
jgi:transposase